MPIFYQPLIPEGTHSLDAEEARHATRVLRLQSGDTLDLTDGKGNLYKAVITELSKAACHFSVTETIPIPKRKYAIHIAIAPTKNIDRIEWFVEKATEMGIDTISFIQCQNSERRVINLERITKKAVSAMKQSGQAWLPELRPISKVETLFEEVCDHKYIAYVDQANPQHLKEVPPQSNYLLLIGPEGDFTQEELKAAIDNGFQKVSLGASTLRTETAGLAACHILNLINT